MQCRVNFRRPNMTWFLESLKAELAWAYRTK